jgi:hypothetical protein
MWELANDEEISSMSSPLNVEVTEQPRATMRRWRITAARHDQHLAETVTELSDDPGAVRTPIELATTLTAAILALIPDSHIKQLFAVGNEHRHTPCAAVT